ncbi:UNVERIFIED_CONTAM: hypothetical protein FKN15_044798 [Acipenser sinensis]
MASNISELEAAKKNLSEALGENIKQALVCGVRFLHSALVCGVRFLHRALSSGVLSAFLAQSSGVLSVFLAQSSEGAGSLPWAGGSACKLGKPKGKKKFSSVRQKFDHRFQSLNPLSAAQPLVSKDPPEEEEEVRLSAHTLLLPSRGQLEARMMVTAFELGLDNVSEDAVSTLVCAVEHHLKDILMAVISRRKAYRLRDGHFKYAFGSNITPQPYLKNSMGAYNSIPDGASLPPGPPPQVSPDEAEQQAALLLACSGDRLPAAPPPVSMFDLLEALQIHREAVPSHTVYALNVERILARLWHPSHKELEQDHVHRQRLAAKEGLVLG